MAGNKAEDGNRQAIVSNRADPAYLKHEFATTTSPPKLPIHKHVPKETRTLFRQRVTDILAYVCMCNDGNGDEKHARQAASQAVNLALSPNFVTEAIVVTALVLLDRVQMAACPMPVNSSSVCSVFVACVVVAAKWIEDYMNGCFGGQMPSQLRGSPICHFETCVLKCLQWKVWVDLEEYQRYAHLMFGNQFQIT